MKSKIARVEIIPTWLLKSTRKKYLIVLNDSFKGWKEVTPPNDGLTDPLEIFNTVAILSPVDFYPHENCGIIRYYTKSFMGSTYAIVEPESKWLGLVFYKRDCK